MIPKAPPPRRFHLPPPAPRRARATGGRLQSLVKRHEEDEKPFDPERAPRWRGSSRDLVANGRFVQNPGGFRSDLQELVHDYYRNLKNPDDLSEEQIVQELVVAFDEESTGDALKRADELLEGFGVEHVGGVDMRSGPPYLYVNFGDSYAATIAWSRDNNKVFVAKGGWAELAEANEATAFDEGWSNWLASEFEHALESAAIGLDPDHDDDTPVPGGVQEKVLDLIEVPGHWYSDESSAPPEGATKELFERALHRAQNGSGGRGKFPEVTEESDGGIFVRHLDVVANEAATMLAEGWKPGKWEGHSKLTRNARMRDVPGTGGIRDADTELFAKGDAVRTRAGWSGIVEETFHDYVEGPDGDEVVFSYAVRPDGGFAVTKVKQDELEFVHPFEVYFTEPSNRMLFVSYAKSRKEAEDIFRAEYRSKTGREPDPEDVDQGIVDRRIDEYSPNSSDAGQRQVLARALVDFACASRDLDNAWEVRLDKGYPFKESFDELTDRVFAWAREGAHALGGAPWRAARNLSLDTALREYEKAADRLGEAWAIAEPIDGILEDGYPFERSFDEVVFEDIKGWVRAQGGFEPNARDSLTGREYDPATQDAFIRALDRGLGAARERQIRYRPGQGTLYVNFYNLPAGVGSAGGGAEAENNRLMIAVHEQPGGNVRAELVNSVFPREYRLRAKAGTVEKIAAYVADYLNKIAREIPPHFTHTRR